MTRKKRIIYSIIVGPLLTCIGLALLLLSGWGSGPLARTLSHFGGNMSFRHYYGFWAIIIPALRGISLPRSALFVISALDNALLALLFLTARDGFRTTWFGGKGLEMSWKKRIIYSMVIGLLLTCIGLALLHLFGQGRSYFAGMMSQLGANMGFGLSRGFWTTIIPPLRRISLHGPALLLISALDNALLTLIFFTACSGFRTTKPNKAMQPIGNPQRASSG